MKFDEYTKAHEAKPMKELEELKSFVYFYEGKSTKEDVVNQVANV